MSLYLDLQKTDPKQPGHVAFPSGLDDEYFQELVAERRTAVKRNGFTVYRWTKDDRQDNEALDTMIIATGARSSTASTAWRMSVGLGLRPSAASRLRPVRRSGGSAGNRSQICWLIEAMATCPT